MSASAAQVARMLALVPYVQEHAGIPVAALAAEFGVTSKDIHRDLNLLVMTGAGRYGGELIDIDYDALEGDEVVYLRDAEFMSRPLRLNRGEAASIIVALRTLRVTASAEQAATIDGALAKLENAALEHVDAPVAVHVEPENPQVREAVTEALRTKQRLHLVYSGANDASTERDVDPLRLLTVQGRRYLEAWCHRAEDMRFFRLDRIDSAAPTGVPAADHDAAGRPLGPEVFATASGSVTAVFKLSPAAAWMIDEFGAEDIGDNRVRIHGSDIEWLRRLALRHADVATVLEPADLRESVAASAAAALAAYDGQ